VRAVVQADADDLVGVGNGREQLNFGERSRRGGVARGREIEEALAVEEVADTGALVAEDVPCIDYLSADEHPGTVPALRPIGDEPHRRAH